MNDLDKKLSDINERLAIYVSEFFGKPVEEVRNQLAENLAVFSEISPQKETLINNIKKAIEEKNRLETNQKLHVEERKFSEIEREVLMSLSPAKRRKVKTMRKYGLEHDGNYFETSYRQFILMTARKEVVETQDSVQFLYAHKELEKQELQLPKTTDGDIFDYKYVGYSGEPITRREIKPHVLDENATNYSHIQKAQEGLRQQNKYIATQENAFNAIFDGFEGTEKQKIRTMQYFTEFVGWVILSLEKDGNNCYHFLGAGVDEGNMAICVDDDLDNGGSLFVVNDC